MSCDLYGAVCHQGPVGRRASHLVTDPPPVVRGLGLQAVPSLLLSWVIHVRVLQQLLDSHQDLPRAQGEWSRGRRYGKLT